MKKFLALLLAATTAISMFAASASAVFTIDSYAESEAYLDAYAPVKLRLTTEKIIVTQPQHAIGASDIITEIATVEDLMEFVEHLEFGEPEETPVIFEAMKEITGNDNLRYGKIYMYDYELNIDPSKDKSYAKALEEFDEVVKELLSTTPARTDLTVADFYKAWEEAYLLQPAKGIDNVSEAREEVYNAAKKCGTEVHAYMKSNDNANGQVPNPALFDHVAYAEMNMHTLITDVYKDCRSTSTLNGYTTSQILYLVNEWNRVIEEIEYLDPTAQEEAYIELYDKVSEYVESDYTADNWAKFQDFIAQAEEIAATAVTTQDWTEAVDALNSANSVKGIPVKYADLQKALMSVYADEKGVSKIDYVTKEYSGLPSDHCLYNEADFRVRADGSKYVYSDEWTEFAINYYTTNTNTIKIIDEYSAYTWVYKLWEDIKKSSTAAKQSEVDEALERFNRAIDRLTPTKGSVAEWRLVMLQSYVDKANGLNEDDFVTTSKKWSTLKAAVKDAENTLRKTNPSDGEVSKVTLLLQDALNEMLKGAKAIPTAMKKELKDLISEADKLVTKVTTQTGAQVVALRDASDAGAKVYENIDDTYTNPEKATISEVQAAIDALKEAIDDFNNPKGWVLEDGKWYYGDYADGWYKIGETWFMFNADGTLKVSEWFKVDGKWYWSNSNGGMVVGWAKVDGKWYFFNQGNAMMTGWVKSNGLWYYLTESGAMATNTTIDGYKVNENGVWVA